MEHISYLRSGKALLHYNSLLEMKLAGRGEDKIMFIYPNAPYHIEKKSIPIIHDELTGGGSMEWGKIEEKVYDYPILTVNEAIENYRAGRHFWQGPVEKKGVFSESPDSMP